MACVQPNEVPDDVIPEDKMIQVLTDVHLLEGAHMSTQFINIDSVRDVTAAGYNTIFKKYGITEQEYKKSWEFYMRNPDIADPLYEKVIENINILQNESLKKSQKK
jgi:hypothetical protein